jgi:hypothetical protein
MIESKSRAAAPRKSAAEAALLLLLSFAAASAAAQVEKPLYAFAEPASWIEIAAPDYQASTSSGNF